MILWCLVSSDWQTLWCVKLRLSRSKLLLLSYVWSHKVLLFVVFSKSFWLMFNGVLCYVASWWPLTATLLKWLDIAHHRWQRILLSVSLKDKITSKEVRARTEQHSIASTLSERRLRWLGHVLWMDHQRIPQQLLCSEVLGFKTGPGRPKTNWRGVDKKDLLK